MTGAGNSPFLERVQMEKKIKISCQGADVLDMEKVEPFQGTLKELSKVDFDKLHNSLVKYGFSFPAQS